ncbi:MAG TPA: hypothetical protein P5519_04660 [Spirochaetia bacterium]|nr:hypothetical protein [Spirochaetales bacterium]HQG40575.1 hypothetical protein [Spirochaetales bacterium]HRS65165.1 hypothetical protein [Spirochaetia bacterium]HRV29596.1 hypothetical protein [Spirochaetia bacterium]
MSILRKKLVLLLIIQLAALFPVVAQPELSASQFQQLLSPDEYLSALSSIISFPDPDRLIYAGFIFSSSNPEQRNLGMKKLTELFKKAQALREDEPELYERGNKVFEILYPDILIRYQETSTTLHEALIMGTYNCVSSAVLFYLVATQAGLPVTVYLTENHMFCRVTVAENQVITVETTSPYGWDPGSPRPIRSTNQSLQSYAYTPKANYETAEMISPEIMIATIASNRIYLLENRKDYSSALKLAVAMYYFNPIEQYRILVLERINNVVSVLINQKKYTDALELLENTIDRFGTSPFIDNIHNQLLVANIFNTLSQRPFEESKALILNLYQDKTITEKEFEQALVYLYSVRINEIQKKEGWFKAWQELKPVAEQYPQFSTLANLYKTVYVNWVSEVHNRFAAFFNNQNYDAAREVLMNALAFAPSESRLLEDLAFLNKVQKK